MKKYRLVIYLCLVVLLTALIVGCLRTQENQQEKTARGRQVLVFAGDPYPPFVYTGDDGKLTGIDIELLKEACRRMGVDYRYKLINWNDKDELLQRNEIDALWTCFSMNGREDKYSWAGPYMQTHHVLVVGKKSNIRGIEDLEGRRLVVQHSSQPEKIFLERKQPGIPQVHDLYSVNSVDAIFSSLQMGYADAAACNEIVSKQYVAKYPKDFVILDKPLLQANIGVAFAKGRTDLSSELHAVLLEMQKDGTVNKIIQKYEKMM